MKKLAIILLLLISNCTPAMARDYCNSCKPGYEETVHNVAGVKLDAPRLVRLHRNLYLGLEGGKNLVKDIGFDISAFEDDAQYFAYGKITYTGTLFSFFN